jgi:hypothetical protein
MTDKTWIKHKDLWTFIYQFLDVNDYFNLELTTKNMRTTLQSYYQSKTKNFKGKFYHKNPKKVFLSSYMNSFVVFNVAEEYNSLEELENLKNLTLNDNNLNTRKGSQDTKITSKKEVTHSVLIDNTQTIQSSQDNTLFSQG